MPIMRQRRSPPERMPLQNRVTPFGEIVAEPWRGTLTGNRGCLHDADRCLGRARWRTKAWISCLLAFRGRHRDPMPPRRWTALFFWDEAMALAAGHRPCGECRYEAHQRFKAAWVAAGLPGRRAAEIDAVLHTGRLGPDRRPQRHIAEVAALPDGVVFEHDNAARLLRGGRQLVWSPAGYRDAAPVSGRVTVLTPPPMVAVLRAGYALMQA